MALTGVTDKEIWSAYKRLKSIRKVARHFGIGKSTVGDRICKIREHLSLSDKIEATSARNAKQVAQSRERYTRYVVTSAQNATPVFKPFWKSLNRYCRHHHAKLLVIPYRYQNPTSIWTQNMVNEEWWCKEVEPHLINHRTRIEECNLMIMGDVKIRPTAVTPLTGFESFSGGDSAIYGHPKLQFETVATPQHTLPKILTTTGTCTIPNYTDSKAGKKGENAHSYCATVIEVDRETGMFHIRQIMSEEGGAFIDLDHRYTPSKIHQAPEAEALVAGDTHAIFADEDVIKATYTNPDSIVNLCKVKRLVWHDLLDFYARNHHDVNNFVKSFAKHQSGYHNVEKEVMHAYALIDRCTQPSVIEHIVVRSNHDEALERWVREANFKDDPENAVFYLKTALAMLESMDYSSGMPRTVNPLEYWARDHQKTYNITRYLKRDENYSIKGIGLANHGDVGANGSRGNINSFAKMGDSTFTGHSHSPKIRDLAWQVGLSAQYGLDYASRGLSSWLQTHGLIYANGMRTLISIIKGKYRNPT